MADEPKALKSIGRRKHFLGGDVFVSDRRDKNVDVPCRYERGKDPPRAFREILSRLALWDAAVAFLVYTYVRM